MKIMQTVLVVTATAGGLYLAAATALFFFQRNIIYRPDPTYYTPADAKLTGVREVRLATPGGDQLIAWYAAARPGKPTLLYFHGNGHGLMTRADRFRRFLDAGIGIFMLSYRGYSGSTGTPTEKAIIADAALAYEHLLGMGVTPEDIIAYGESLGTGVAVQLAGAKPVRALVLDAPYTSILDVGRLYFPIMPIETILVDHYASDRNILKVKVPILILHGTKDRTIPFDLGLRLFNTAPEPKEMAALEGAGHSDIYEFGALERLQRFLDNVSH
jgi:fermentation-respiration switch protein FrsA (DUF1100 family)